MEGEYSGNCNSERSNSKKKKTNHGHDNPLQINLDRISHLHDSLLIKIVSLLETKDAFKTGILSKRWKNVWTHVDNLLFECEPDKRSAELVNKFISFVNYTLMHCTSPNLKRFTIYVHPQPYGLGGSSFAGKVVDKFVQFILKKNVECFELLTSSDNYRAPEWFYHKSSFVELTICHWEIKILGQAVSWHSLKILVLAFVKIDDEQMAKILMGCPVLEDLTLDHMKSVTHLNIVSPSVRKLVVTPDPQSADLLDLNAPWLREFEIFGFFTSVITRLINVSSLTTAKIELGQRMQNFDDDEDLVLDMACQLLESIHHIKELTLTHLFIQALSVTKHMGRPSPLFMCKHLTVHLSTFKYDFPGIVFLLQSSPNLENLVIEVDSCSDCHFPRFFNELDVDISLIPPRGNTLPIKNVKLIYDCNLCFRERRQSYKKMLPEMALAKYLFQNAPLMGKLVTSTQTEDCKKCATNCASKHLSLLSSKFFRVCRSSKWQDWNAESLSVGIDFLCYRTIFLLNEYDDDYIGFCSYKAMK